jgi:hypothetical protein
VIEETSGHARTFARKFCVSGHFLDLSRRNARTFPPSGWPEIRPPPELWPKGSGKFGLSGQTSGQPEVLNNPGSKGFVLSAQLSFLQFLCAYVDAQAQFVLF